MLGGIGTSFSGNPLPPDQFPLGSPLHLGAYSNGEIRGNNYYILTGGYLRQIARLPDFIGGPIYAGAWLENGDAFNLWSEATLRTQVSLGVVMESIVGFGPDWRIGRIRRPLADLCRHRSRLWPALTPLCRPRNERRFSPRPRDSSRDPKVVRYTPAASSPGSSRNDLITGTPSSAAPGAVGVSPR